ncbi:Cerato-platanin [Infundibulicybe gibba]|nr:Cerato-platanin [Infundibulicybe gibba]
MKFITALASLGVSLLPLISAIQVTFDPVYDNPNGLLTDGECTDGNPGRGFTTYGGLPGFPHIGGAAVVTGFNSAGCGTCWQLVATTGGVTRNITVIVMDGAGVGFNIAEGAMNDLTGGQAVQLGLIDATATQVAASVCGLVT